LDIEIKMSEIFLFDNFLLDESWEMGGIILGAGGF